MSKVVGIFVKFWYVFTMPAHQIWSYRVTQEANFENFLFCPNSTFNIRKSHKISSGQALYFRSYQPKTLWGWKIPPLQVPLGLKLAFPLKCSEWILSIPESQSNYKNLDMNRLITR